MLKNPHLQNQNGMAVFEIVPILVIFILLLNFSLGFFGAIHSGIVSSIAARNYAFETFRNRANLNYLRDVEDDGIGASAAVDFYYLKEGFRFHGVVSEQRPDENAWFATKRPIKFTENGSISTSGESATHNRKVAQIASNQRASDFIEQDEFSKIWVRTLYGICLNMKCGN